MDEVSWLSILEGESEVQRRQPLTEREVSSHTFLSPNPPGMMEIQSVAPASGKRVALIAFQVVIYTESTGNFTEVCTMFR